MRTAKYFLSAALGLGMIANVFATKPEDTEKPKHTIKEIMDLAHKKGLYKKVVMGNASADDKTELASLYSDLVKNTPEKGSPESWKEKAEAVASAAKDVAADKPDSIAALKKANNCGGCHKAHK
jgi:hypothetical protein